jgi:hypothetical protein
VESHQVQTLLCRIFLILRFPRRLLLHITPHSLGEFPSCRLPLATFSSHNLFCRWAEAREEFFWEGINKHHLRTIEKASFVMLLEHRNPKTPQETAQVRQLLQGKIRHAASKAYPAATQKNANITRGYLATFLWRGMPIYLQECQYYKRFTMR